MIHQTEQGRYYLLRQVFNAFPELIKELLKDKRKSVYYIEESFYGKYNLELYRNKKTLLMIKNLSSLLSNITGEDINIPVLEIKVGIKKRAIKNLETQLKELSSDENCLGMISSSNYVMNSVRDLGLEILNERDTRYNEQLLRLYHFK